MGVCLSSVLFDLNLFRNLSEEFAREGGLEPEKKLGIWKAQAAVAIEATKRDKI